MTADKDDAAASDAAQRAILRTQSAYISRLVGEKSELIAQVESIQAERDAAIRERDEAVQSCIAVGRARDAWKARADAAMKARHNVTRERDEALEASALFQRDVHKWRARAEAAEARTTPAVTREDVDDAVRTGMSGLSAMLAEHSLREAADAVCALFGVEAEPADPVEAKARELYEVSNPDTVGKWETIHEAFKDGYRRIAEHVLGQESKR